jgi:Complex I intermediate-associated protein 30 (CIA30)
MTLKIPFKQLKPTYRGREKKDAKAIDLKNVRRVSVMCRSFFAEQEGDFELVLKEICAVGNAGDEAASLRSEESVASEAVRKGSVGSRAGKEKGLRWWEWFGWCMR